MSVQWTMSAAASTESWVRSSDSSAFLRSVMSRQNAHPYSTPPKVNMLTLPSTGNTLPVLVRCGPSMKTVPSLPLSLEVLAPLFGCQSRIDVEHGHAQQLVPRVLQMAARRLAHLDDAPVRVRPQRVVVAVVKGVLHQLQPLFQPACAR